MTPIRIVLVDDHAVVREGLRLVLGQFADISVVGEASDERQAIELAERVRPDIVIMDIALGSKDGVAGIEAILARVPESRVLVLTMFHDAETLHQCLLAGASGYVVKGANSSDLVDAIRAISRGERYIHSSVVGLLVDDSLRWLRDGSGLSRREREVLSLLGGGRTPARNRRDARDQRPHGSPPPDQHGGEGRGTGQRRACWIRPGTRPGTGVRTCPLSPARGSKPALIGLIWPWRGA